MVAAVRRGQSLRAVAEKFAVGVATVAHWVERAKGQRLDRVDFADRSRVPHQTRRTDPSLEDLVLQTRRDLAHGDLGALGAAAIHRALVDRAVAQVPSVRTINRILGRRGALDGRQRTRRPPPPTGWYLPDVAKYVSGQWSANARTVGELVVTMTKQGLRFAPATRGDQEAYTMLHRAMSYYAETINQVVARRPASP